NRAAVDALVFFRNALSRATSKERAVREAVARFAEVRVRRTPKPKVAIFGDVYTRYNDVMNQGLIRTIEDNGGEVVITPFSEYMMMVADPYIYKWFHEGCYSDAAIARLLKTVIPALEERYHRIFREVLDEPARRHRIDRDAILRQFVMDPLHTGESMENLYKIFTLAEAHPDLSLFVQANPAFCCPSLVTQAMSDRIESLTGIPVVTIEYDGIGGFKNESVIPYLRFPRERRVPDALRAAE
ncbi:MAG TPA: CoA activase, partial [Spirochaetota bacterium]|nr:CoA activase [Spirochaetota bacterium]